MKFIIPHVSLFGLPVVSTMRLSKKAGFDGVEVLLTPFTRKRVNVYREVAKKLNLIVHFHQAWSYDENPTHSFNRILAMAGYLPKKGYRLLNHIPASIEEPVVIYGDRFQEAREHPNWWLQVISVFNKFLHYKLPYREFVHVVQKENFPVVFDTQHIFEYGLDVRGVEFLTCLTCSNLQLLKFMKMAWKELGSHVKEIQLNDCDPSLGHFAGRNVFLGEGRLPLKEFCKFVKESGWDGIVTTEVAFGHMKYRLKYLAELNRRAREMFQ